MHKHRAPLIMAALIAVTVGLSASAQGSTEAARNGRIVFQASVGQYKQLFTINANGTGLKQLTHISFSGDTEGAEQADWSPDGSKIAFDGPSGNRVNIFTIRPNGTGLAELPLTVTGFNGAPAYSPDGTKIAFDQDAGPAEPTVHGIFVANADGSAPHRVTTGIRTANAYDTNADWSPDGSRLSFTRVKNSKQAAIYVVKINGNGLKRLTPWKLDAAQASWAPDGSKLVFESYNDSQPGKSSNLFTIRPNGGAMTQLTHFTGGATQALGPAWSPDGKKIVWHKISPQLNQLFLTDSRGAAQRQLTHMRADANPGHADWAKPAEPGSLRSHPACSRRQPSRETGQSRLNRKRVSLRTRSCFSSTTSYELVTSETRIAPLGLDPDRPPCLEVRGVATVRVPPTRSLAAECED